MAEKKFYWLKLQKDFFKRHDIKIIKAMPNGKDYVIFYLTLLLESLDHNGELRFSDTIPYSEDMLSVVTETNIDIVRSAMKVLTELKMVEVLDDDTIFMTEVDKMLGCETKWAEKKRLYRGQCPQDVLPMSDKSKSKSIELDIDKDIDNNKPQKHKFGEYQHVLLTDEELEKLKSKFPDYEDKIKKLDEGIELKGYKYKSHYLAILKWAKGENDGTSKQPTRTYDKKYGEVL